MDAVILYRVSGEYYSRSRFEGTVRVETAVFFSSVSMEHRVYFVSGIPVSSIPLKVCDAVKVFPQNMGFGCNIIYRV